MGMTSSDEAKLLAMRDYVLKLANAISRYVVSPGKPFYVLTILSFSSRLSFEPEIEKHLRTAGDVELQKLGVVPQTVFLKSRAPDPTPRSSRATTSRRSTGELSLRSPNVGTPRMSRASSIDHGPGGAPFEDLRRRLATINASGSSSTLASAARSISQIPSSPLNSSAVGLPHTLERSGSPSESVVSNTNSSSLRPIHRLQVGSTDGQKAVAAIGSSRANASGLLEAPSKIHSDGSPERSGRSSPHSLTGTIRGIHRHRVPSLVPISTYGKLSQEYVESIC